MKLLVYNLYLKLHFLHFIKILIFEIQEWLSKEACEHWALQIFSIAFYITVWECRTLKKPKHYILREVLLHVLLHNF